MDARREVKSYQCDNCGAIYEYGWSEEEAKAEELAVFGNIPENERAIVCNDCYKLIMEDLASGNP